MVQKNTSDNLWIEFQQADVEQSVSDRFRKQVENNPEKIAIRTTTYELTYDALDRFSNRIAQAIIAHCGREKDMPIGVFFGHDEMMIIAMLGVLKAGKISVMLDSTQSLDRLAYLLEDSQPSLIVTNTQNLGLVEELTPSTYVLNIDDLDSNLSDQNIDLSISPDNVAFVIYTSGSTGQPKGTVYSHRCLLHLVKRYTNSLRIRSDDRMLLISSSGHLAGINTIFRGLLNGSTVFPFDIKEQGLAGLVEWLIAEKITFYNSVPTVFRRLVNSLSSKEQFPHLRVILLGGELVTRRDVNLYKQYFSSSCIFINNLGCTELSGYRQFVVDKQTQVHGNILPVGYATEGTEVILLDEAGNEVGANCTGEITLKSRYLASGYWRRIDLTGQKFLSTSNGGDERIYRTGDLGYMLPDGCLVHLGRKDSQIIIKSQRVEIAEVEMVLLEHPLVKEAAVVVWNHQSDAKEMVACVVPHQEQIEGEPYVSLSNLQDYLKLKLPEYMVPSNVVCLNTMPLQPSGKVDLRTLSSLVQIERSKAISSFR